MNVRSAVWGVIGTIFAVTLSACGGSNGSSGGSDEEGGSQEIITVELISVSEGTDFLNSFGYYRTNNEGLPASGQIIWANVSEVPVGDMFIISPSIPEEELGFFLIPNGGALNSDLEDGDDVTFDKSGDAVTVIKDNAALISIYQPGQIGALFGFAPAFYSDASLNSNGAHQVIVEGNIHRWEDLINAFAGTYQNLVVEVVRSTQ